MNESTPKRSIWAEALFYGYLLPQAKAWGKCLIIINIQSNNYHVISVKSQTSMVGV